MDLENILNRGIKIIKKNVLNEVKILRKVNQKNVVTKVTIIVGY